jgi:flagellar biosynthetic protein FliO
MLERRHNTIFNCSIVTFILIVSLGLGFPQACAEHSFRANAPLPENDTKPAENNSKTNTTIPAQPDLLPENDPIYSDLLGIEFLKTDPLRIELFSAESVFTNLPENQTLHKDHVIIGPVENSTMTKEPTGSPSDTKSSPQKDPPNASPAAPEETDKSAQVVSPWENQLLGRRPENADASASNDNQQSQVPSPWKTFVSLIVVLALIVGATYLFKRFALNAKRGSTLAGVEILARSNMNPKQSLCLVQLGNRLVLLGQSPNHISTLQTIEDPDEIAQIMGQMEQKKSLSITNTFNKLFHREKDFYQNDESSVFPLDIEDNPDQNQPSQQWCQAKGELSSLLDKVKGLSKIRFRS